MHACNEATDMHCRMSFAGRQVLKAHGKLNTCEGVLLRHYYDHQSQHRPLIGALHNRGIAEAIQRSIPDYFVLIMCLYYRTTIPTVTLCMIMRRVQHAGHLAAEAVHQQFEIKSRMKRIQKVVDLDNTVQENEEGKVDVPDDWPKKGDVHMKDVKLRYRPGLDLVLKGLTVDFDAGLKIGCVGRTGAGKSTLGLTLLRILEIDEGSIIIDGVNIRDVALQTLRKRITTIPQDPVLFKGTIKFNLDPEDKHPDKELDDLLVRSGLDEILKRDDKEKPLREFEVEEGGKNLSDGEKQLVCICRAALRKAKVVIFDEATANIDVVTEQKIMALIR